MKIILSKEEWDICTDFLIQNLDFDKFYDMCVDDSKNFFPKHEIISTMKSLIKEYPNFDITRPGRVEANSSILSVTRGYLNGYMFVLGNSDHRSWIMTTERLFQMIEKQKKNNSHYFIFDTKDYLRNLKIKKICQISTKIPSI